MANTIETEPTIVHLAVTNKNDPPGEAGSITHLEGGNIEALEKLSGGYELQEFVDSRQKTPFEKRLVWKIDLLIVPTLALIYFVSFLDRNSLGNARVMGLQKTLHMSDQQYYNCAQMFFVGYTLCMLPGNILIRWMHPNWQFGVFIVIFGTLVAIMGAAQNYATVIALRILIGFAQAFIQGTGLYGSLWWKRDEVATRGSLYFSAATLSGAFSGLIAYAIQNNMPLIKTGKEPWRWLFIIEGVLGVVIGILVVCILPRFPDKIKNAKHWLFTPQEIELAITRVANFNTRGSKLEWRQIFTALMDPKAWALAFINGGLALALSSVGVFLPTFIHDFGYTAARAQLFSVIPYSCAFACLPTVAIFSDRMNTKAPFLIGAMSVSAIGYILLLTVYPTSVKMFATCLICSGLYTGVVLLLSWIGINIGGFTKRGTVWAMAEIVGQCFSIMGSNVYTDKPRYIKGHSIVLAFLGFAIANAIALTIWMRYQNRKRDRLLTEYALRGEAHPHVGRSLEEEFDAHINFRYII